MSLVYLPYIIEFLKPETLIPGIFAVIAALCGGIFTLGGAFAGAYLAGQKTLQSINSQINYDLMKNKQIQKERLIKTASILKRHGLALKAHCKQLAFLVNEKEKGFNRYEVDFSLEINIEVNNINAIKQSLESMDVDLLPIDINDDIQHLLYRILEVSSYLDTYLKGIEPESNEWRVSTIKECIQNIEGLAIKIENFVVSDI